jgi:hypothetical protein
MGLVWFLAIIVLGGVVFAVYAAINKRKTIEKQITKRHKKKSKK